MKPIELSKGMSITKTRTGNSQKCVACGKPIGEHTIAISLHNYNDHLSLKKNVWMHIGCVNTFKELIDKGIDDNEEIITVESI